MSRRSGQCLPCLDLITLITLFNVFRPSLQKCFQTVVDHIVVGVGGREDSCRLTVISSQWWRPVCLQLLLILKYLVLPYNISSYKPPFGSGITS